MQAAEGSGDQAEEWQTLIAAALLWSARDYQHAEDYCKRALQLAQAMDEPRLIGHSLNRLGNWYLNTGQLSEALGYHEQALAIFEALDDLPGKGETLDLLGITSGQMMRGEAALDYYRTAIAIFRSLDDRKALVSGLSNLASWTFDVPLAEEAVSVARQIGWYSGEAYVCISLGYRLSCFGRFTETLSYLQRGFELARAIDHTQWLANAHVYGALAYRDLLELTTAADHARKTVALAAEVGSQWFSDMGNGLLASILIEQGQLTAAEEVLARQSVPESSAMQHMMLIMAEVELALAHSQGEAALASCERMHSALALADTSSGMGALMAAFYFVEQARALMLLDRQIDAQKVLEDAQRLCTRWSFLPFLWWVDVLLGQAALDEDDAAAQQCFQHARDCIEQLTGYVPSDMRQRFRQRAEKIIASAEKRKKSITSQNQLTRRELDVAREIALGKTNQQIADELHVTVKTVEAHITRILSKLYLTSRTQIALWAVDNQLLPPSESD